MNIAQAKDEIKRAIQIYFQKDEAGTYVCPPSMQRPILLIGPPGIGKTAIMEQLAQECGVGLVAYTMTHHTRQSAIGLPRIVSRDYNGETVQVTEYTLSEMIASVRDCMQRSGRKEGILFLDEINCVSETLAPVMLQLLQNKTFGMHPVPPGWLICAAGNPPEYNRSAKPFDLVTLDRVRTIPIEPDLDCWMEFAAGAGVHEAVLSYLQMKPEAFYQAESNASRQVFVTARGWTDLAFLLTSSEAMNLPAGEAQIRQYLGDERTAREFASYYRLSVSCRADYNLTGVLRGELPEEQTAQVSNMLKTASLEERYLIYGLMTGYICREAEQFAEKKAVLGLLREFWKAFPDAGETDTLQQQIREEETRLQKRKTAGLLPYPEEARQRMLLHMLGALREQSAMAHDVSCAAQKALLEQKEAELTAEETAAAERILAMLEHAFTFASGSSPQEGELLVLLSGLSRNPNTRAFLAEHRSETFLEWSARLLPIL